MLTVQAALSHVTFSKRVLYIELDEVEAEACRAEILVASLSYTKTKKPRTESSKERKQCMVSIAEMELLRATVCSPRFNGSAVVRDALTEQV